jgi:hypothetical protein
MLRSDVNSSARGRDVSGGGAIGAATVAHVMPASPDEFRRADTRVDACSENQD